MDAISLKCKMCGGTLHIVPNMSVCNCEYCGSMQTVPRLGSDKKSSLYDRANYYRQRSEFDKATQLYEQVLAEEPEDAESYWSLVLCRYGIQYVEDPGTRRMLPTVNRIQFSSIYTDGDYKSALQYADEDQKALYQAEAADIDRIQKDYLAISDREAPYDVFICYKESDENGNRTPDSVLAYDLYGELTKAGYRVFFARISLEDKLGSSYEPYIFSALCSAKAMVVLGTKTEYFNAVWVKNEWSRYLGMIRQGEQKVLIPAYKDISPYELPEDFSHLQAQDMGKLGWTQDLVRGVGKLIATAGNTSGTSSHASSQKEIFSQYSRLLPSMSKMESLTRDICQKETAIDNCKHYFHEFFTTFLGIAILVAGLTLILQFFWDPMEALFNLVVPPVFDPLRENAGFIVTLLLIIPALVFLPLLLGIATLVVLLIIYALLLRPIARKKANRSSLKYEKENLELCAQRDQVKNDSRDMIKLVPKSYRTADALQYVINLYSQARVDSAKESFNMYEAKIATEKKEAGTGTSSAESDAMEKQEMSSVKVALRKYLEDIPAELDRLRM